jgi:predicted DNA-binding transcriptional regulator AlpA
VVDLLPPDVLDDRDILLTRPEAAQYLRRSTPTMERWARQGTGPRPIRIGRSIYYRLSDLRVASGGQGDV